MVRLISEPDAGLWTENVVKRRLVISWEKLQQDAQLMFPCDSED